MKNQRTQFEFKTISGNGKTKIKEIFQWCLENLPLKNDKGVVYWVDELFITTSSQKIVDKINAQFGSKFSFGAIDGTRIWYVG